VKRVLLAAAAIALAMPARPAAHQLDEYLQAARIAFARDRVVLELDLTPGANIAGEILASVDRDRDGIVHPLEARAYGEAVIGDIVLELDGRPVRLTLETIEVPAVADMQRGVGTMQLTVVGALDDVRGGTHELRFSNRHHPAASVYLANALVPGDRDVQVVAQRRDHRQQQIDVEYKIGSQWPLQLIWVLAGVTVIGSRVAARRTRTA
jgi:hypothetical protein